MSALHPHRGRAIFSLLITLILMATGVVTAWVLVTSDIFGSVSDGIDGPLAGAAVVDSPEIALDDGATLLFNAQLSQPRDPFRPLVTEDSPPFGEPGTGEPGSETGNGNGFTPTITVLLEEIRDVSGVLRATVVVDGTSFDVGVGDTFADQFKVVSLSATSGVFMFGDSVFTLNVGQQILK